MTTYVDVALEEIRKDYPEAYEILKEAVIPEYKPFLEETVYGADGYTARFMAKNNPQLIINCPEVCSLIEYKGLCEGSFTLGGVKYSINHMYKSRFSSEHQLILELEKITKE